MAILKKLVRFFKSPDIFKVCKHISCRYPTGRKLSSEFKCRYFANGEFPKFEFRLLLYFLKSHNDSSYN